MTTTGSRKTIEGCLSVVTFVVSCIFLERQKLSSEEGGDGRQRSQSDGYGGQFEEALAAG